MAVDPTQGTPQNPDPSAGGSPGAGPGAGPAPGPGVPLTPPDPNATNPVPTQPPMFGMGSLANLAQQFLGQNGLASAMNQAGIFPGGQRQVNFRPDVPSPGPWRQPWTMPPIRNSGWGQPNWMIDAAGSYPGTEISPSMPSPMEALNIIGGAGRQLSQWAPAGPAAGYARASQLALQLSPWLDLYSKGAFSRNYAAARMGLLKNKEEEMVLEAAQARQQHQQILQQYDDIIGTFNAGGYGEGAEGEKKAEDALIQAAAEHGDTNLQNIIRNRGVGAAGRFLADQDQRLQAMWAGESSITKSKAANTSDSYWRGDDAGGGTGVGGFPDRPSVLHPDATQNVQGPGQGVQVADTQADNDAALAKKIPQLGAANSPAMQAVHDRLRGIEEGPAKGMSGEMSGAVSAAASLLGKQISQIAQGPGTPDEKLEKIRKLDGDVADDIHGMGTYQTTRQDLQAAQRQRVTGWTRQVYGNQFRESNYDEIKELVKGPTGRSLARAPQLVTAAEQVLAAVNDLDRQGQSIPRNVIEQLYQENWNGDGRYNRLHQALRMYAIESSTVATGTGSVRVSLVESLMKGQGTSASPGAIRAGIRTDLSGAMQRLNNTNNLYHQLTGSANNLPFYTKDDEAALGAISRMNPWTGEIPDDKGTPAELLSLSRRNTKGVPRGMDYRPLTKERVDFIKGALEAMDANDPARGPLMQELQHMF